MSKLDDLIRERGCDDLTAIHWLKERRATVDFSPELTVVTAPCAIVAYTTGQGRGASLSAAIIDYLTIEASLA